MPDSLTCYACDREPFQQCSRCGRPYCEDHGDEFCGVCLHPASGVPSFTLYRGSLLALLAGTALAVWLLVQPSGSGQSALRPVILTPTPVTDSVRTDTPMAGTPGAQQTPTPAARTPTPGTPAPGASPTPRPGTPAAGAEYTVAAGDSLSGICENRRPANMSIPDCIEAIKTLNNLTSDILSVGQRLRLPQ